MTWTCATRCLEVTDLYEVLWGEWLKDWNKKVDHMLIRAIFTLEQEVLMVENNFTIHIFHQNPEGLGGGGNKIFMIRSTRMAENLRRRKKE